MGPVTIDWSHPLAQGLTVCILFQSPEPRNLVDGAALTKSGGAYFTPGGQYFDEVDDYYTLADVTLTNKLSVACQPIFTDNSGSAFQYFLSWGTVASANTMNMYLAETTASNANKMNFGTTSQTTRTVSQYWPTRNGVHLVASYNSAATPRTVLYYNGVSETLEMPATTWSLSAETRTLYVGWRNDLSTGRQFGGKMPYLFIYGNRILSSVEATAISLDPYQFLIPA